MKCIWHRPIIFHHIFVSWVLLQWIPTEDEVLENIEEY